MQYVFPENGRARNQTNPDMRGKSTKPNPERGEISIRAGKTTNIIVQLGRIFKICRNNSARISAEQIKSPKLKKLQNQTE